MRLYAALLSCVVSLLPSLASADAEDPHRPLLADRILIQKHARRMTLFADGQPIRVYSIALGGNPVGHKQREGDERTPEGAYSIESRNPRSAFHLALRISYPNAQDRARAREMGVSPGGDIMIHGIRNGLGWLGPLHWLLDWTDGCVAVTNREMEEIWELVEVGTPVEITP